VAERQGRTFFFSIFSRGCKPYKSIHVQFGGKDTTSGKTDRFHSVNYLKRAEKHRLCPPYITNNHALKLKKAMWQDRINLAFRTVFQYINYHTALPHESNTMEHMLKYSTIICKFVGNVAQEQ